MATGTEQTADVLVRAIPKDTLRAYEALAKKNRRSRNSEIVVVLSQYIEQQQKTAPEKKATTP